MSLLILPAVACAHARQGVHLQRVGLGTILDAEATTDGARMVTGGGRGAFLWDVDSGSLLRGFAGHSDDIVTVDIASNGNRIIGGSADGNLYLWDAATGTLIKSFAAHAGACHDIAFSPDDTRFLTAGADGHARLWHSATGSLLLDINTGATTGVVAFHPSGTEAVLNTATETPTLYDLSSGTAGATYSSGGAAVTTLAVSSDGTYVYTGHATGGVHRFNYFGGFNTSWFETFQVTALVTGDNPLELAFGTVDGQIRHIDGNIITGFCEGLTAPVRGIGYVPGTVYMVGAGGNNTAHVWDTTTVLGEIVRDFRGHSGLVGTVALSADGSTALVGSREEHEAKLYDVGTGAHLLTFDSQFAHHQRRIPCVVYSQDGTRAYAGGTDGNIYAHLVSTGVRQLQFTVHDGQIRCMALSPNDTMIVTGGDDNSGPTVRFSSTSGWSGQQYTGHTGTIGSVQFTSDSQTVLSAAADGFLKLTHAFSGSELQSLNTGFPVPFLVKARFTAEEGRVLAGSAGDTTARLFDFGTGAVLASYAGHTTGVTALAISPDNTMAATGDADGGVRVWDLESGELLRFFDGHYGECTDLTFSPDGRRVVSGGTDGACLVWEIAPPRAVIVAGGGNYTGNGIARQTDELAAYAFRTLKARGYTPDNIQYLSAFGDKDADGDGLDDVDGNASRLMLQQTLTGDFATSAGRLLVLMIDHGYRTGDFMAFRLNRSQVLSATRLKSWLDELQTAHPTEVTLAIDCCYSGKFCDDLMTTLPAGAQRHVIASTTDDAVAVFLPPPDLSSFLYTFLSSAYMGNSLGDAFQAGKNFFETFPVGGQIPQINDGSGSTTNVDSRYFGASWSYGIQSTTDIDSYFPVFESGGVMPPETISVDGTTRLWVRTIPGSDPSTVTAALRPPAPQVVSGDPVTTLATFALSRKSANSASDDYHEWEATVGGDEVFGNQGPYTVVFTARFASDRVANPAFSAITVSDGSDPDQTTITAVLAFGDSTDAGVNSALLDLSSFAYEVYWTRFQDNTGVRHHDWISYFGHNAADPIRTPAPPTAAGVLAAIDAAPADCGRLYVHLAGESGGGGGMMRLASGETLSAADLDTHLDTFQSRAGSPQVVLIVDTPAAGYWMQTCRMTAGQDRVVLASGRVQDPAVFLDDPPVSFSRKVLAAALQGATLFDSFQSTRAFFSSFLQWNPSVAASIQPLLDDDGDAIYGPNDGNLAATLWIGRRYAFADDSASGLPFILDVSTTQTVEGGTPVNYSAALIDGVEPSRVFLQLVPEDLGALTQEVLAALPETTMTRDPGVDVWTWSSTFAAPAALGNYAVVIHAEYPDGPAQTKLSTPAFSGLIVAPPPTTPDLWESAPYNDSASATTANSLLPGGSPQFHSLHDSGDSDWIMLQMAGFDDNAAPVAVPYSLDFGSVLLQSGSTIKVDVYTGANGLGDAPDLYTVNSAGGLQIPLLAVGARTVYARVYSQGLAGGQGNRYSVALSKSTGDNNGIITQIGSNGVTVIFGVDGPPPPSRAGGVIGYNIYRWRLSPSPEAGYSLVTQDVPIPASPTCSAPAWLAAPAVLEYQDLVPEPTWPLGSTSRVGFYGYQVVPVTTLGEQAPIWSSSAIVDFSKSSGFGSPYCVISSPVTLSGFGVE